MGTWIRQCAHVQVDETPWLIKGVKEWMWVACGVEFCLFHAADTRSRAELETLLGQSCAGVLSSDDFSVYNGYAVSAQQKCVAHLRRHFKKVFKLKYSNNPQLTQVFLDVIDAAFEAHRQWRETQDAIVFRQWSAGFKLHLLPHSSSGCPKLAMLRVYCCVRCTTKQSSSGIFSTIQRCHRTTIALNAPCV